MATIILTNTKQEQGFFPLLFESYFKAIYLNLFGFEQFFNSWFYFNPFKTKLFSLPPGIIYFIINLINSTKNLYWRICQTPFPFMTELL